MRKRLGLQSSRSYEPDGPGTWGFPDQRSGLSLSFFPFGGGGAVT